MKLQDGIYNKAVYWPRKLQTVVKSTMKKRYKIMPTFHAQAKIQKLDLPTKCYMTSLYGEVIEAEIENGIVTKVVTRLNRRSNKCNVKQDMCFAIVIDCPEARVKTVWLNATNDVHKTLHIENYVQRI